MKEEKEKPSHSVSPAPESLSVPAKDKPPGENVATINTEYTSPSKSIKNFFRNRSSAYSIESISEEPELGDRGRVSKERRRTPRISIGSEASPSRASHHHSTPPPAGGSTGTFNSLLQLKFGRSKASVNSASSIPDPGYPVPVPATPADKPTTIDDFADTSSSESYKGSKYDSDSINSILDEYEGPTLDPAAPAASSQFVFKEEFDEGDSSRSSNKRTPTKPAPKVIRTTPPQASKYPRPSIDVALSNAYNEPEPFPAKRASGSSSNDSAVPTSGSSSSKSMKFRILPNDRIEPVMRTTEVRKDRKEVISASSNVDVNRSSFYNMTTISDSEPEVKYPDPDVTPAQGTRGQARDSSNTIEIESLEPVAGPSSKRLSEVRFADPEETALRQSYRSSLINPDETELKSKRDTIRSSLSSGELLQNLENPSFDRKTTGINLLANKSFAPQASSTLRNSQDYPKGGITNLTAGLDSSTELPVMLYKVQDKDYDEGNQRWSVYEHKRLSDQQNAPAPTQSSDEDEVETTQPPQVYASEGRSTSQSTFKSAFSQIPLTTSKMPETAAIPPPVPRSVSKNQEYIDQNFNEHVGDFRRDKPRQVTSKVSSGSLGPPPPALVREPHNADYNDQNSFDLEQNIEKHMEGGHMKSPSQQVKYSWYSPLYFVLMMILGLIVPPIYFLIALGVFDSTNTTKQFYTGLTYKRNQVKRFSKTQKILSLVIGILWFSIAVAMIGVGVGLGTRHN